MVTAAGRPSLFLRDVGRASKVGKLVALECADAVLLPVELSPEGRLASFEFAAH